MASKLQDQSCSICFTEDTEKPPRSIVLHCGASCCQECLVEWFVTKIKENYTRDAEIQVPCIFSGCKEILQVQEICSQLTTEHQARINEELFQVYLNNQQDVRRCPKNNCPYAGIISFEPCTKDFQCELCSTAWRDETQQTKCRKVLNSVKNELLSHLWKFFFSKKCPGCKSAIVKYEGCDHITCLKCSAEFCWQCPSRYPTHTLAIHKLYPVFRIIFFLIIGLFILRFLGGFAYLIPPVRFVLDWTLIPVWNLTVNSIRCIFSWISWAFWLFRDFLLLNSILMCFANAVTLGKHDMGFRIGGLLFGSLCCYLVSSFGIIWPVVRFGICEVAFIYVFSFLRNIILQNKKKAL